jgi:hypothetical protein
MEVQIIHTGLVNDNDGPDKFPPVAEECLAMTVVTQCPTCHKAFRAKDRLAGKVVKCPGCGKPMKIEPVEPTAAASSGATDEGTGAPSHELALQRVEEARRKRAATEEEEAARQKEVKDLVQAWEQLSGSAKPKGKEGPAEAKIGTRPMEVTWKTRVQDAFGILKSTLIWKYIILVVFLIGGATASSIFIYKVVTVSEEESRRGLHLTPADIPDLYKEAEEALAAGDYTRARQCLNHIIRMEPHRKNNIQYKEIDQALLEAAAKGK